MDTQLEQWLDVQEEVRGRAGGDAWRGAAAHTTLPHTRRAAPEAAPAALNPTVFHPPGAVRVTTPAELAATAAAADTTPTPRRGGDQMMTNDVRTESTNPITPALTAAEWNEALASDEAAERLMQRHVREAAAVAPTDAGEHLRAAAALANHLLPDGHPRKITRPMVEALRNAVYVYHDSVGSAFGLLGQRQYRWDAMANTTAVFGALLPPGDAR